MAKDRFLIAPLDKGVQSNVKPWLILEDAFQEMVDMYSWRGSIRKRVGARVMNRDVSSLRQQLLTRLRINIGTTEGELDPNPGDFNGNTPPGSINKIGQMFSIGDTLFTVYQDGAMYSTGAATGTYDIATGVVSITGNGENPNTAIFFYPAEPVMHLATYQVAAINDEELIAFDTRFAYQFSFATGWSRIDTEVTPLSGANRWSGGNADFYWSANYRGAVSNNFLLFVTNDRVADNIRYWNGTGWEILQPIYNAAGNTIDACKVIMPFKGRLLLMNVEQSAGGRFINRVRWSQVGDPIVVDAFQEDIGGKGDFKDFPVKQAIIGAEYIKDRLIVFLESSTWEVVDTGNFDDAFVFQQLNSELGIESGNSIISFDKQILGIGAQGIHSCNGMNVERIDQNIPDNVFKIINDNAGPQRVAGIRDYYTELVHWSVNSVKFQVGRTGKIFPNSFITYNYINGSWSYSQDSITAFGNYQITEDLTWENESGTWQEALGTWESAEQLERFKNVIAGNQQGFTFIVDSTQTRNSISLQISNIAIGANGTITLTVIDHNITDLYIYINGVIGITNLNDKIYPLAVIDRDTIVIPSSNAAGAYAGGGTIERVARPFLATKDYNFYNKIGKEFRVEKVDIYVDRARNGEMTVVPTINTSGKFIGLIPEELNVLQGSTVLSFAEELTLGTNEKPSRRFWNSMYLWVEGETIALFFTLSPQQNTNKNIALDSDIQINALLFHVSPTVDFS